MTRTLCLDKAEQAGLAGPRELRNNTLGMRWIIFQLTENT